MLKSPGRESTRSQLTRPNSLRRKRSSSTSRSVRGAKSACPPSEATTRWRWPSQMRSASQPRARGDQRHGAPPPGAGLERSERRPGEREHPVARRLEVVEQPHPSRGDARAERRLVDLPGEIGRDAPPVDDGSGDAEAGGIDPESPRGGEEARHGVLERRKLTARELRLALEHERTVAAVEQGERRLGPTDVAGEEHYFLAPA